MSRKVTRQSRVSMERIRVAANSRLMRLAQKMIVGGTLLLDRVARTKRKSLAKKPLARSSLLRRRLNDFLRRSTSSLFFATTSITNEALILPYAPGNPNRFMHRLLLGLKRDRSSPANFRGDAPAKPAEPAS